MSISRAYLAYDPFFFYIFLVHYLLSYGIHTIITVETLDKKKKYGMRPVGRRTSEPRYTTRIWIYANSEPG